MRVLETIKELCQHCGNLTIFEVQGSYNERELLSNTNIYHVTEWRMMKCMTCTQPMLEQITQVIQEVQSGYEETYEEYEKTLEEPEIKILYPITNIASIPEPSSDMPPEVAEDYKEARAIFGYSPRSSAALLRLALQKLCKHLGLPGNNLNNDIKELIQQNKLSGLQKALDSVRIIGNNAVHPAKIDLRDNKDIVLALFEIVNFIVKETITNPRELEEIYNKLPEDDRKWIQERDRKMSSQK